MNRSLFAVPVLAMASVVFCASRSGAAGATPADTAREAAAQQAYSQLRAMHGAGTTTSETVYLWSVRVYQAQKKTRSVASPEQEHLARMTSLQASVRALFQAGAASKGDDLAAAYYVAEAQVWVNDGGVKP